MVTILHKMFLSKSKLKTLEEKQKIRNLISDVPVYRKIYVQKNGTVVINHLYAVSGNYNIHADRIYDWSIYDWSCPHEKRVSYRLLVSEQKRAYIATNSHIDKVAESIYSEMQRIHNKEKQRAR